MCTFTYLDDLTCNHSHFLNLLCSKSEKIDRFQYYLSHKNISIVTSKNEKFYVKENHNYDKNASLILTEFPFLFLTTVFESPWYHTSPGMTE